MAGNWKRRGATAVREHQEYLKDAVVITIRKLVQEYPLQCSFTASELLSLCAEKAGGYPTENAIAFSKKLKKVAPLLFDYDQIVYKSPGINGSHGARKHTFYRANYQASCM